MFEKEEEGDDPHLRDLRRPELNLPLEEARLLAPLKSHSRV
jgi:hypothetical protein